MQINFYCNCIQFAILSAEQESEAYFSGGGVVQKKTRHDRAWVAYKFHSFSLKAERQQKAEM